MSPRFLRFWPAAVLACIVAIGSLAVSPPEFAGAAGSDDGVVKVKSA